MLFAGLLVFNIIKFLRQSIRGEAQLKMHAEYHLFNNNESNNNNANDELATKENGDKIICNICEMVI